MATKIRSQLPLFSTKGRMKSSRNGVNLPMIVCKCQYVHLTDDSPYHSQPIYIQNIWSRYQYHISFQALEYFLLSYTVKLHARFCKSCLIPPDILIIDAIVKLSLILAKESTQKQPFYRKQENFYSFFSKLTNPRAIPGYDDCLIGDFGNKYEIKICRI